MTVSMHSTATVAAGTPHSTVSASPVCLGDGARMTRALGGSRSCHDRGATVTGGDDGGRARRKGWSSVGISMV